MVKKGQWKFDDDVASRFDEIARSNIPHYEEVLRLCVEITESAFPDKKHTKIIDVGSATGNTMQRFLDAGYERVHGVDNSQAMLAQSRVKNNLILSESFPKEHGPFDIVVANWTLHFIEEREPYLRDIRDSLSNNGILILSEKMTSSALVHKQYHAFKREMGVSEVAIKKKETALKGVLVPRPLEWYLMTLKKVGFRKVEIVDAAWCFNTLLCTEAA